MTQGGDYVTYDLRFHQGLLKASHNRMLFQMGKAFSALLRTSFELSTRKKGGPAKSLPLHRAVLDAVIARNAAKAERAFACSLTAHTTTSSRYWVPGADCRKSTNPRCGSRRPDTAEKKF